VEATFLDDAIFQYPGFGHLILKIHIRRIDTGAGQFAEQPRQIVDGQATDLVREPVLATPRVAVATLND